MLGNIFENTTFLTIFIIVISLLVVSLIVGIIITYLIARVIYFKMFVRNEGTWGRQCSDSKVKVHKEMYDIGLKWGEENKKFAKEVHIMSNDNLNLYAEYYDFGFDTTTIIAPGRSEALTYSYYYAIGYKNIKSNLLLIDQRAHGKSDGKYSTAGIKEAEDILLWAKYLHDELKQNKIFLHGICVGSCASVIAAGRKDLPSYIKGVIVDGLFIDFVECIRTHTIDYGKPAFPVVYEINFWYKKYAKVSITKITPKKSIKDLTLPILFLHSKKDKFSLPSKVDYLYKICPSKEKTMHYFEDGDHSHLRIAHQEEYDKCVEEFFKKYN